MTGCRTIMHRLLDSMFKSWILGLHLTQSLKARDLPLYLHDLVNQTTNSAH